MFFYLYSFFLLWLNKTIFSLLINYDATILIVQIIVLMLEMKPSISGDNQLKYALIAAKIKDRCQAQI